MTKRPMTLQDMIDLAVVAFHPVSDELRTAANDRLADDRRATRGLLCYPMDPRRKATHQARYDIEIWNRQRAFLETTNPKWVHPGQIEKLGINKAAAAIADTSPITATMRLLGVAQVYDHVAAGGSLDRESIEKLFTEDPHYRNENAYLNSHPPGAVIIEGNRIVVDVEKCRRGIRTTLNRVFTLDILSEDYDNGKRRERMPAHEDVADEFLSTLSYDMGWSPEKHCENFVAEIIRRDLLMKTLPAIRKMKAREDHKLIWFMNRAMDFGYDELAELFDVTEENARQICSRVGKRANRIRKQ